MVTATIVLALLGLAIFPATQVLRDRLQARRERDGDYAGTQDVAIYSTVVTFALSAVLAVLLYFVAADLRERQKARTASLSHPELHPAQC